MNTPIDHVDAPPPDDSIVAGEYVLGVLERDERAGAAARIARDPAFAALVDAWEGHFAGWNLRVEPVAPGVHVWPRIRAQLGWNAVEPVRKGVWNSVAFWRAATSLAAAAGVAGVALLLQRAPAPTAPPVAVRPSVEEALARPVTVLAREDGSTGWIARIDPASGEVLMVPVPAPADARGRVNELWIIPAGRAPISLGAVSSDKAHTVVVPENVRSQLGVGATLAITLESAAGIPHAAPAGPIIAKGGIARL